MTDQRYQQTSKLTPAGWLAVVVVAVLLVGVGGLLLRPLGEPIRALPEAGLAVGTIPPTITPYVKPSVTPAPTATPLPGGWTQAKGLNGQMVFVPPAGVEQEIKAAFEAAWACNFIEDAPDAILQTTDQSMLCQIAYSKAITGAKIGFGNAIEIVTAGPVNPIQCATLTSCELARAKLEVKGVVLFGEICTQVNKSSPCVARQGVSGLESYQLWLATVGRQEDGTWKVVKWVSEKLPGPPPSH